MKKSLTVGCVIMASGLIPGQKHTTAQFRLLLQQRRKPQPNGIVAAGQAVQQHRNTLRPA